MPLKVIGAGLGRTGTMSLKLALERLGFGPCHHMAEVLAHPEQLPFWNRAADGEAIDWESVYRGYGATVDWPGAAFSTQLAERYPNAKVILSRRDPKRWCESMRETILKSMELMGLSGETAPAEHPMRFGHALIAKGLFGLDYSDENVIAAYERHNAEVVRNIPAARLLVFDPVDGWAPLCSFLAVDVPSEPFPRTNARDEFWAHVDIAQEISATGQAQG